MRVHFYNNIAPPSDYFRLNIFVAFSRYNNQPGNSPENSERYTKKLSWEESNKMFTELPAGFGSTAVLGPPDVYDMLETRLQRHAYDTVIGTNVGGRAWTVTAMGMWISSLPDGLITALMDAGWFGVRLEMWKETFAKLLIALRRVGAIHPAYSIPPNCLVAFRKLANITYREKDEADWEAEKRRRTIDIPIHYFPTAHGYQSRSKWLINLNQYLRQLTSRIVHTTAGTLRLEDMHNWWNSRFAWAPAGSSSVHGEVEQKLREHMEFGSGSRATKKTVAAMLDDNWMSRQLLQMPARMPRASTKHEPGGKARALYAVDDRTFMVASYPSVAMEKFINIDGIYAQQAPTDIAEWVRKHIIYSTQNSFFLSLDYSDFNTEHETSALYSLDLAWASAWVSAPINRKIATAKAYCSMWTAESHYNAWVLFPGDEEHTRIESGLFSGDRNTARDNCMLHAAYSKLMVKAACELVDDCEPMDIMYTGDDEDGIFSNWVGALAYMACHSYASFTLKGEKQLTGDKMWPSHEYLQRTLTMTPMPMRPLAAAIAQLCSGNWYNTNYVWLDGIIQSVNDNCWELHLRGLPLKAAKTAAVHILNRAMQARKREGGWKKLEWWQYRTCGKYHPLWDYVSESIPPVELGTEAIQTPPYAPGVAAWKKKAQDRFGTIIATRALKQYEKTCMRDAMAPLYKAERNREMHRAAVDIWPSRHSTPDMARNDALIALPEDFLKQLITTSYAERHPNSLAQLASRLGMDLPLLEAAGGMAKILPLLPPQDMAQVENIMPQAERPWWAHRLDSAIASWLMQACVNTPKHWLEPRRTRPYRPVRKDGMRETAIVLAGNASGKSTTWQMYALSGIVDLDRIMRESGVMALVKQSMRQNGCMPTPEQLPTLVKAFEELAPTVVLTQMPIDWMVGVLRLAKLLVRTAIYVTTDIPTTFLRTVETRSWDLAKATRRVDRFNNAMLNASEWASMNKVSLKKSTNTSEAVKEALQSLEDNKQTNNVA